MRQPADFGGYAASAVGKGVGEGVTNPGGAAYAVEERGLEDAWDTEGRGCEEDAERWCWTDEEVL